MHFIFGREKNSPDKLWTTCGQAAEAQLFSRQNQSYQPKSIFRAKLYMLEGQDADILWAQEKWWKENNSTLLNDAFIFFLSRSLSRSNVQIIVSCP